MYGLIHSALRQMIIESHGEEIWSEVLKVADISEECFFSTQSYDDALTFTLIQSVSDVLGAPLDDCLDLFGQFWLEEFAPQSYDMLLHAAGSSLFEFLENLNSLHDRISTTFVGYVPPSFQLERINNTEAILKYRSSRTGMVPFVIGLIKGMQDRFDLNIAIHSIDIIQEEQGTKALIHLEVSSR